MLAKKDLENIRKIIEEKIDNKTNHLLTKNEFFGKMDELIGELKAIRKDLSYN